MKIDSAREPRKKTPHRPRDESVSSVESTLSELSLFDSDSTGEQTPITPFETPTTNYFPRATKDKNNDFRRLLWPKEAVVEDTKKDVSSGSSMLAVPDAIHRARATSAPATGQKMSRNEIREKIEDLVGQFGDVDLNKDAMDTPSFKKPTRKFRGRQRNIDTTGEVAKKGEVSKTSAETKSQKAGGPTKVSFTTRNVHDFMDDFDPVSPRDDGHLRKDSSTTTHMNPTMRRGSHDDHDPDFHMPLSQTAKAQSQVNHVKPSSATNVVSALSSNPESHIRKNIEKSSTSPSEALEGLTSSQVRGTEDPEPISLEKSTGSFDPEPERATSATAGTAKPRKPRNKPSPRLDEDPGTKPPVLKRFSPPISKRDIKIGILHYLRQSKFDPKPNFIPHSRVAPKLGGRSKVSKEKLEYDNSDGYVYIFTSPSFPKCFKIGSTKQRPEDRRKQWETKCKLVCTHIPDPEGQSFPHYRRVEKLVHLELVNERRIYECVKCKTIHYFPLKIGRKKEDCAPTEDQKVASGTKHGEWFEVSEERALAVVAKWRKWVVDNEPYRKDGSLREKWVWKFTRAENSVEMNWGRWLWKKIPKILRASEPVERDWDWDRWGQMRWDDWSLYISHKGIVGLRTIWPELEYFLWHPGLIVWIIVGIAPIMAYAVCGGGKIGIFAALEAIVALILLWLFGTVLKS
jgi:hypothetical protein